MVPARLYRPCRRPMMFSAVIRMPGRNVRRLWLRVFRAYGVANADNVRAQNLRPEAPAMYQAAHHATLRDVVQMLARFAETRARMVKISSRTSVGSRKHPRYRHTSCR
jgi:hypothetical protein